jgi:hypothetical protein
MAYVATTKKSKSTPNNFGGLRNDGNRIAMTGAIGNYMFTEDSTTSPVVSPVTVNTSQTLTVPQSATQVTIVSVTNAVRVSETADSTSYFSVPPAVPMTFDVANQQYVYLTTAGSTVVSFCFNLV